ncbi:hypothetical protein HDV01_001909 [Terramyces sp. JEL0728]|nr:hypothetical protein HDV01_001909 [Terramyces sp. JEL0728]
MVVIDTDSSPIYFKNHPVLLYKVELACTNDGNIQIHRKTNRGMKAVTPVYMTAESTCTITIPKIHISRTTNSLKYNIPFHLVARISVIGKEDQAYKLATFTSENLNVFTPAASLKISNETNCSTVDSLTHPDCIPEYKPTSETILDEFMSQFGFPTFPDLQYYDSTRGEYILPTFSYEPQ